MSAVADKVECVNCDRLATGGRDTCDVCAGELSAGALDVLALDPWNVYRELDAEGKLTAAAHWREYAAEPLNGTQFLRDLCVEVADRLEAEAAFLAHEGRRHV